MELDSSLKWLGGPLGPEGKQYVVIAIGYHSIPKQNTTQQMLGEPFLYSQGWELVSRGSQSPKS